MNKKLHLIVLIVSVVLFVSIIITMSILPFININNDGGHKTIDYLEWLAREKKNPETYKSFMIDQLHGKILASSIEKGTYEIKSSPQIISSLTHIDLSTGDIDTTSYLNNLNFIAGSNISFGDLSSKSHKDISIWLYVSLSILSMGIMMVGLQSFKMLSKRK